MKRFSLTYNFPNVPTVLPTWRKVLLFFMTMVTLFLVPFVTAWEKVRYKRPFFPATAACWLTLALAFVHYTTSPTDCSSVSFKAKEEA